MVVQKPDPAECFECLEIRNPPETELESVRQALNENPQNALLSTRSQAAGVAGGSVDDDGLSYLAVNIKKNWQPGRTITIKFLSGEAKLHAKVKEYAKYWLVHANLKFSWLDMDAAKADIRIDFQQGGGCSSRVGTDALTEKDQKKRTMNLDIKLSHPNEYIRRKVLHEFGHVLGCEHEHQSPLANFEWNKKLIYTELSGPPNNWSRATIDHNVITRLESSQVSASAYDGDSIMLYEYPARWFLNSENGGTKNNTTLSKRDKEWIATNYPPSTSDIGHFSTLQVRSTASDSGEADRNDVAFEPPYAAPPRVAVGLSWLDLDYTTDISVSASAEDIEDDHFTVAIAPGKDSRVVSAACSWLEASASEQDIKMGQWSLSGSGAGKGVLSCSKVSQSIKFDARFDGGEAPVVVAFFSGLSLSKDASWRVKTWTSNPSPFKFQLNVEAVGDTILRDATVTWVAFPAGKEGMAAGTFCTDDIPGEENAGTVDFSQAGFATAPAVMMAISGLDFERGSNLRLRASHSDLSKDGLVWHLDSWLSSGFNTATGTYVAIGGPKFDDDY